MKKILIFITLLITIVFANNIMTYSSESWTKEDYLTEIGKLEAEINDIQSEIDSIKAEIKEKNEIYMDLRKRADTLIDDENLLNWFNTCDKFSTRANVIVIDEVTRMTRELIYSSGVVYKTSGNNYYVITIASPFPKQQMFMTQNFYIEDCFGYQYNATKIAYDSDTNLMVLGFVSTYSDANIYSLEIAELSLNGDDLICHIFSNGKQLKNHMDFTTINTVIDNSYETTISMSCSNYGFMGVGFDNKLHSLSYSSESGKILSYNERYIRNFLINNNLL